jgi:two-component system, chemotaxis family, sensor kinase CheA
MDELLRDFIAETNDHLAVLERDLVAIEGSPADGRLLDDAFRSVHSIKGTCGFLGLKRLETLLHAAEDLLGKLRDDAPPPPAAIGALLSACDRAKTIVGALAQEGHEAEAGDDDIIARLELVARSSAAAPAAGFAPAAAGAQNNPAPMTAANTVRVDIETIDRLMAEVGEMVLARNQLTQTLRGRTDPEAALALERLSQVTSNLQESVMKTRLQPIGHAWARLPRMVRDLGRELGKKIELELEGGETELDRHVLELVKDPFTHLLRNAADHGIEPPAERRRAGKPETGTVALSARQEGGAIVITLSDDGRGIDPERVRAAIRRGGFVGEAELSGLSEHQLLQFVFHPGFTTAAQVTSVSGRGVGLDVVRSNAERIGGAVEIVSNRGHGTCVTIKIPLTLAIVPALLLECAGQRFAVPQSAVVELVRAGAEHRLDWIQGAPVLRLRGSMLPLVFLHRVVGIGKRQGDGDSALIAIIGYGTRRFGVIIDGADDAGEIVVKPLSPVLHGIKLFAGSTVLGDGSVVLILDPGALAAAVGTVESVDALRAPAAPLPKLGGFSRGAGLLLFRAGSEVPKALPLASILRIEAIDADQIAQIDGKPAMTYRGLQMPLHVFGAVSSGAAKRPVVIVAHAERMLGFLVDAIIDTVEEAPVVDRSPARAGLIGVASIAGRPTEIIDVAYYTAATGARILPGAARSAA